MTTYTLEMSDGMSDETEIIEAETDAAAIEEVAETVDEWVRGGYWGADGASMEIGYTLRKEAEVGYTVHFRVHNTEGQAWIGKITVREGEGTDATFDGDGPAEQDIADAIDAGETEGAETIDGIEYRWAVLEGTSQPITDDVEVDSGYHTVGIEPDHEDMIDKAVGKYGDQAERSCGNDPEDHEWTSKGEGGCDQNPGVWATGGTSMLFASHCRKCGLHREEHHTGSQRNPGEHDTASYEMPDNWCAECEAEECTCPKKERYTLIRAL
jgi:hypothetical protein